ncbi:MAG: DegT/DnrJ/EryC1/StrS family aminotransferase [Chitinophagales bacterium]
MNATSSIVMVDLQNQTQKIREEINTAIMEVIDSTQFIGGTKVNEFCENLGKFIGVDHVIPCNSGTDALQIAMMALGIGPGDEVITPDFTYFATAEVIGLLGATPIFVDVDKDHFTILPEDIEQAITPKTKAIVPVHLFGQAANMQEINRIAEAQNLYVIEDCAQSIGCTMTEGDLKGKSTGNLGDIGCFSFFPSKNLGAFGDGGAITTSDPELAKACRQIANHGQGKRYYHDRIGVNSRLDAIQAAILQVKLKHLDTYISKRRWTAAQYDDVFKRFDWITTPKRLPYCEHSFHQYVIRMDTACRDQVIALLSEHQIAHNIYYPLPLQEQKAMASFPKRPCPNTAEICQEVLALPMHTELTNDQIEYIASIFEKVTL